jgi:hypothetical protein
LKFVADEQRVRHDAELLLARQVVIEGRATDTVSLRAKE